MAGSFGTGFGHCLNCGDRVYQDGDRAPRHAGSHEIRCNGGLLDTCAALSNDND